MRRRRIGWCSPTPPVITRIYLLRALMSSSYDRPEPRTISGEDVNPYPLPVDADVPPPTQVGWNGSPMPALELDTATKAKAASRLVSLDAYRGLVMILMVSAGLRLGSVVKNLEHAP